jgi:hypothetical protein
VAGRGGDGEVSAARNRAIGSFESGYPASPSTASISAAITLVLWYRSAGSRASARLQIASSSAGTLALSSLGGRNAPSSTARPIAASSGPSNRRSCASVSHRIAPSANTSLRRSAGAPRSRSGAV